jgi:GTPase
MNSKSIKVAIVGAPNAGKSSLLNRILGKKNSIVSPKPHTTRGSILGIKNIESSQIVFIDTPGFIRQGVWANSFQEILTDAMDDADLKLLIIDATQYEKRNNQAFLKRMVNDENLLICLNKIDLLKRGKLYEIIAQIAELGYQETVFLISADRGDGIQDLVKEILSRASEQEWLSEAELPRHIYAAECVREKVFHCIHQEVPFGLWTRATKWYFRKKPDNNSLQEVFTKASWKVYVDIIISNESHKGILIGEGGNMIKRIGTASRTELESIWGPGQLFLNVIEDKNWQKDPEKIKEICNMTRV